MTKTIHLTRHNKHYSNPAHPDPSLSRTSSARRMIALSCPPRVIELWFNCTEGYRRVRKAQIPKSWRKFNISLLILAIALCTSGYMMAMNILRPYDTLIRMPLTNKRTWQLGFYAEGGVGESKAFGEDGRVCDALSIWQSQQNALTMLQGFDQNSPMTLLRNELNAADDGIRGHFKVTGDLDLQY